MLDAIQKLLAEGNEATAKENLVAWLTTPPADATALTQAAMLAETLGMPLIAIRAWQLVLREQPDAKNAWSALADLHTERGDHQRAATCRQRAGLHEEAPPPIEDPLPTNQPPDADLIRFLHLFAGREDTHARMWREGDNIGWSPVHAPLTLELLKAHLHGSQTLGIYLIRLDGTVAALALDLDIKKATLDQVRGDARASEAIRQLVRHESTRIQSMMQADGFEPLIVDSGYKGRHFWIFPEKPLPAATAWSHIRALGMRYQPTDPNLQLEAFPKQAQIKEGGLGNLIKLPLAVHLRTSRKAVLLDASGNPLTDPWPRLRQIKRASESLFYRIPTPPPASPPPPQVQPRPSPAPAVEPRGWNEADYDADPEIGTLTARCPVIASILKGVLEERRLKREAALVLQHTVGHLPNGPRAVNYAFDRVPGFPSEQRMGAPLRGSPVSCAKIRQRVPEVAGQVPCDCVFEEKAGEYPHPLRHLEHPLPAPTPTIGIEDLLDAYGRLLERQRLIDNEVAEARRRAAAALSKIPDRRWRKESGEWVLEDQEGFPVLKWVADP
jgi:tetratricopeptide (TPR) repeat protein